MVTVFDDFNSLGRTEPICGDPTCYRGRIGGWNYQFKDGPCNAADCRWPRTHADRSVAHYLAPRPHFTDTPAEPIVDAGKEALAWLRQQKKS